MRKNELEFIVSALQNPRFEYLLTCCGFWYSIATAIVMMRYNMRYLKGE